MEDIKFRSAWLSITYDCNNRCIWCYSNSSSNETRKNTMSKEMLNSSRKLLKDLGIEKITLIGGEPTMYKGIEEIVATSKEMGFNVGMVSNGRKFSSKKFTKKIKESSLDRLTISIEGSNREMHDKITQVPGSFEQSIRGIDNCHELGIPIATESTVSYINQEDLPSLVRFLKSKSIGMASFNVCGPCLTKEHNFTVQPKDASDLLAKIYKTSKEVGLKITIVTPQPLCNFDQELIEDILKNKAMNTRCYSFYGRGFVVDFNGDILPCVHYSGFPFFNIKRNGDYISKDEFLEEFFSEGKTADKFRKKLWNYPSTKCAKDQDYGAKCLGGCPLFWFKFDPEEQIKGK